MIRNAQRRFAPTVIGNAGIRMKHLIKPLVPSILLLGFAACSSTPPGEPPASVSAQQPVSQSGATDPQYDWEKPSGHDLRWSIAPTSLQSTKTLDQTTTWLRWALERNGHTHPTNYDDDISNVRIRGCAMEWTETQKPNYGVTSVAKYSASLGDLNLERSGIHYSSSDTQFKVTDKQITISTLYYENGKVKDPDPRITHEGYAQIPLRGEEDIPARVAFALFHAGQLCGAKLPAAQ